ncbi:peptidoglycan D,D-transpeptidase FtsI [Muribaculaceae bacterium]|jgi:cell division protein FtsI (penicillin-binding protein 3)|nr:peptidoglycan D,D-transpeptidase FtsI [Muribaculaceae bacterium]
MKRSKHASILARYLIITAGILLAAGYIAYCTFKNTVLHANKWNERAHIELSRSSRVIPPERGDILASDGTVLATTLQYYTLRIDFGSEAFKWQRYADALDSLADAFDRHFPIAGGVKAWQDSLRAPLRRGKKPRGWRLIKNITYADYQLIRTQFPFFHWSKIAACGLTREKVMRRRNPYGDMAKLSIGVVSERENGETHGMSGLEYALDSLLFGHPGLSKKVNFTRGIGDWIDIPAQRGYDVVSTIDVQMQDILENALLDRMKFCRAEWGTAVLMEVATGEIKAISNLEEYPLGSGSGEYVEAMNRAVQRFEPGSVVKTLSMMIAVEDGLVRDTAQIIPIGRSYRAYGQGSPITDSHFNAQLSVAGVLEESSNIGMAKIITPHYRDPQAWHDRVARLGFLDRLGSGIGEERAAYYPVVPINKGGLVTLSRQTYGYATEIPPLHTLSIYNAIANGGRYVRPRLVKALRLGDTDSIVPVSYIRDRVCSESTAKIMQSMLARVVHGARGTARSLKNPYVALAGKTGTCYSVDPLTRKYDKSLKRLAFCGFFPADAPKYSCVVLTYHPRENALGAASTSGVVLKNVALDMFSRGLLDNNSDFRENAPENPSRPTMFNTCTPGALALLNEHFGIGGQVMRTPVSTAAGSVPDVRGMGLRDAVARLENENYNVTFTGTGYVRMQQPAPATPLTHGATVTLTLSE